MQILRVPNLLTVPGDPIAGFALAGGLTRPVDLLAVAPCVGAALLLYCSGLIFNDLFDLADDARDRPNRPLPAGEIAPQTARIVANVLMAGGLALAALAGTRALVVAAILAASIFIYDAGGKRIRFWGPANMGICRGLSVFLGACAAPWYDLPVIPAAMAYVAALYVAVLTSIAKTETTGRRLRGKRFSPACIMGVWLVWCVMVDTDLLLSGDPRKLALCLLAVLAFSGTIQCGLRLRGTPDPIVVQQTVGVLVRILIPLQAMFVLLIANPWAFEGAIAVERLTAGAILLAWPVSAVLARRFYAS